MPFKDLDVSAKYQPFSAPKKWFFGRAFSFLSFLEFVPRITPLKIELGNLNLSCMLSGVLDELLVVFNFFGSKFSCAPILGEGVLRSQKRKNYPFSS